LGNEVIPADRLFASVQDVAREIASHAPLTLRAKKEAIRRLQHSRRLVQDEDLIVQTYMNADCHEGVTAFLEKRPLVFRGQ
jgi:enoyl-CoA hydratase/carnithine racemase